MQHLGSAVVQTRNMARVAVAAQHSQHAQHAPLMIGLPAVGSGAVETRRDGGALVSGKGRG